MTRAAALLAVIATYLLIVLGGAVRATGSGLGCPDWPLCQGGLLPPDEVAARVEYAHRVAAGTASALVLLTAVLTLRHRPERPLVWTAVALPLVLASQVGLGALSVVLELPAAVVAAHLALAFLLLGLLVFMATYPGPSALSTQHSALRLRRVSASALVAVYLLALSGAWVRASGASWACAGFPLCNGELLPFGAGRLVDIHLLHRFAAYAVGAHLVFTLVRAARAGGPLARWGAGIGGCLALQGAAGALGVLSGWSPAYQVLHVAGGAALWAMTAGLFSTAISASVVGGSRVTNIAIRR